MSPPGRRDEMQSRRTFMKETAAALAAAAAGGISALASAARKKMQAGRPRRGLVVWYSQTGNTERHGRLIARVWEKQGLAVTAGDYRDIGQVKPGSFDIIVAGSPVYYYEAPENFRNWLRGLPAMDGTPVAAFATCGGEGGNQYNTAHSLIEIMTDRGGAPAGMITLNNMSTYAVTWSMGNRERILKYRNLPDEATYERVRAFAGGLLDRAGRGEEADIPRKKDIRDLFSGTPTIRFCKLMTSNHHIELADCIGCGACEKACPVKAVDRKAGTVNTNRCVACLGCVNNCPTGAMTMDFMGKRVRGWKLFSKEEGITIREPAELAGR
jgi:ferredoxin/flavodoxin